MLGNFSSYFLSSADIFQNKLFQKILSGTLPEYKDQAQCSVGPDLDTAKCSPGPDLGTHC